MAELSAASVQSRVATGERAGRRVRRLGDRIDTEAFGRVATPLYASVAGVSLHAGVGVPARDRARLERLCRYVARPPIATERLSALPDGNLSYRLRHRWRDGTTHVVFEPLELIERLVALIPPPRAHQVRYHGVLAPCAGYRDAVVPGHLYAAIATPAAENAATPAVEPARDEQEPVAQVHTDSRGSEAHATDAGRPNAGPRRAESAPEGAPVTSAHADPAQFSLARPLRQRLRWADLMRRVFEVDVLACPRCGGRMQLIAAIEQPRVVEAILRCLGFSARPPPMAPARPIGQPELPFVDAL